jgi:serine protease Do
LQLKNELKKGINYIALQDTTSAKFEDLGKFLVSVIPDRQNEISALSSRYFDIPKKLSSGYFGASANFINQQIILTSISPASPAAKAGLELKDQITGINNVPIKLPPEYGGELMKYEPEEVISIQGVRNGVPYSLAVNLTAYPPRTNHPAYRFAGGKSIRLDGFKRVFAHDAIIRSEECGGPVFDASGKFYGINISRFSRTCCLAISSKEIYEFINRTVLMQ